jgi:hypothetical protein
MLLMRAHQEDLDWPSLFAHCSAAGNLRWLVLTMRLAHELLDAPLPAGFPDLDVTEALPLAAAQLWITHVETLFPRILAGRRTGDALDGTSLTVPLPKGSAALHARAAWVRARISRAAAAVRAGALRPRRFVELLRIYRDRDRLAARMREPV